MENDIDISKELRRAVLKAQAEGDFSAIQQIADRLIDDYDRTHVASRQLNALMLKLVKIPFAEAAHYCERFIEADLEDVSSTLFDVLGGIGTPRCIYPLLKYDVYQHQDSKSPLYPNATFSNLRYILGFDLASELTSAFPIRNFVSEELPTREAVDKWLKDLDILQDPKLSYVHCQPKTLSGLFKELKESIGYEDFFESAVYEQLLVYSGVEFTSLDGIYERCLELEREKGFIPGRNYYYGHLVPLNLRSDESNVEF